MDLNQALAIALRKGHELHQQGNLEAAEAIYRRILRTASDHADALHLLGLVRHQRGDQLEALELIRQAVALRPRIAEYRRNLATVQRALGDLEAASATLLEAVRLWPEDPAGHLSLGVVRLELGRFEEAADSYREALRLEPGSVQALSELGLCDVPAGEGAVLLGRILARLEAGEHDPADAARLHYAAARLLEKERRYDEAFFHIDAANRFERARSPYSAAEHEQYVDTLIATFDRTFFSRIATAGGSPSEQPIFIVGVPRSGTTLVEQILSSHPQVFGAGELEDIGQLALGLPALLGGAPWPECVAGLEADAAEKLAAHYLAELRRRASEPVLRVTDKMPANYFYLGLIARLFPRARVVHCRRDPLDSCLSIYFTRFRNSHPYAHDLRDLGAWHRQYQRLMAHWREVLPLPVLELDYEALVARPEPVSRELVTFCGLEWDERCLEFYRTERAIQTASAWQARQPVYRTSAGRWRRYERWLDPLKEGLGWRAESREEVGAKPAEER